MERLSDDWPFRSGQVVMLDIPKKSARPTEVNSLREIPGADAKFAG